MARRRLTTAALPASGVPRAERTGAESRPVTRSGTAAPIAHEAADAAGAAALGEMAHVLETARRTGRMILDLPLDAIAPDHLSRDRIPAEDEEMAALRESLRAHGQRTPVEVTALDGEAPDALPYGLISGWRRLMALRSLHAETGDVRFATVQAILRNPDSLQDAYVNMVEENEIRVGLSQYERARVAALAARRGVFADEEAALRGLFGTASRAKRSRIRSFLEIYHALDGVLRFPAHLPERLGLKLTELVRTGGAGHVAEVIARDDPQSPEAELEILGVLTRPLPVKAAKRRSDPESILPGVTLEQTLSGRSLTLKLKGRGVTPELRDQVQALLRGLGGQD